MLKENEKERLKKFCEIEITKRGKELDLFDYSGELDSSISYGENKAILLEKINTLFGELKTKEDIKNEISIREYEKLQEIRTQEKEAIERFNAEVTDLKANSNAEILEKFKVVEDYIQSVANGTNNALIFLGKQGIGKTYFTRQVLNAENCKYVELRGITTPKGLYNFLYENNSKDTIILIDDTDIFDENTYSILLSALWDRLICWNTTKNTEYPKKFYFDGRIIILSNRLGQSEKSDILKSRCLTYFLDLTREEKLKVMYFIAKQEKNGLTQEERVFVVDCIKDLTDNSSIFDLRTQQKAENLLLHLKIQKCNRSANYTEDKGEVAPICTDICTSKNEENGVNTAYNGKGGDLVQICTNIQTKFLKLITPLIEREENMAVVEDCLNNSHSIKDACIKFMETTGKSRRTFFNYLKSERRLNG